MLLHEVPRLRNRNDCYDAGGPLRRNGRHRCVRPLPSVLVRSFRELAALSRLHAEAHEVYRRTLVTGEAIVAGRDALSAVRDDAAAGARHAAKHAVHVLAMRERRRPLHQLSRVLERKEFHSSTVTCADRGVAAERSVCELLQLWGVHQPGIRLGLSLLPLAHLHARYETAAAHAGAAQASCRAEADGSDAPYETRFRKVTTGNLLGRSRSRSRMVDRCRLVRPGLGRSERRRPLAERQASRLIGVCPLLGIETYLRNVPT